MHSFGCHTWCFAKLLSILEDVETETHHNTLSVGAVRPLMEEIFSMGRKPV